MIQRGEINTQQQQAGCNVKSRLGEGKPVLFRHYKQGVHKRLQEC